MQRFIIFSIAIPFLIFTPSIIMIRTLFFWLILFFVLCLFGVFFRHFPNMLLSMWELWESKNPTYTLPMVTRSLGTCMHPLLERLKFILVQAILNDWIKFTYPRMLSSLRVKKKRRYIRRGGADFDLFAIAIIISILFENFFCSLNWLSHGQLILFWWKISTNFIF